MAPPTRAAWAGIGVLRQNIVSTFTCMTRRIVLPKSTTERDASRRVGEEPAGRSGRTAPAP